MEMSDFISLVVDTYQKKSMDLSENVSSENQTADL